MTHNAAFIKKYAYKDKESLQQTRERCAAKDGWYHGRERQKQRPPMLDEFLSAKPGSKKRDRLLSECHCYDAGYAIGLDATQYEKNPFGYYVQN
jgi:hypothetical protein